MNGNKVLLILMLAAALIGCHFCYAETAAGNSEYSMLAPLDSSEKDYLMIAFWLVVPAVVLLLARSFLYRDVFTAAVWFPLIIVVAILISGLSAGRIWSKSFSKENIGRYSKNPIETMKKYPLSYGMTRDDVKERWGIPSRIFNIGPLSEYNSMYSDTTQEYWYYYRRGYVGWKKGSSYEVKLIFWDGKLKDSYPGIDLINKGQVDF